jgi:replicative DNA helicase
MRLSAPIYHLKRNAKQLSRLEHIDLHAALDRIAVQEGFRSWGLLAAKYASRSLASRLYASLQPGDMMLIGARPGQGKTRLALEIAAEAIKHGHDGVFFSLAYTEAEVMKQMAFLEMDADQLGARLRYDCSDDICADYIVDQLSMAKPDTLVVVDYLQAMDQKRTHPPVASQVLTLRSLAARMRLTFVFVSQIVRTYDPQIKPVPDLDDVRLPNPVDLALFTKTHFIGNPETA